MKHIVWLMCLWLLASCIESREEAMLRLVNEWKDKSVIIPIRSVFTVQGMDVPPFFASLLRDADAVGNPVMCLYYFEK